VLLGDGSRRASLREEAEGVERLDFLDLVPADAFPQALASADALLVNERPGVAEMSVPSKLTSYFDSGRPIIAATDPGGVTAAELAASNAGITVPSGRPEALVETVLRLREDPARAAELGSNGRRYRAEVLRESEAVDRFADTIAGLASRK
jgi:colanic acid biosynthesis glycosyl transferase WcaI